MMLGDVIVDLVSKGLKPLVECHCVWFLKSENDTFNKLSINHRRGGSRTAIKHYWSTVCVTIKSETHPFTSANKNAPFKYSFVGAGSPCKSNVKSFNTETTGDIKPALFTNQIGITSNDAKRAGYKFISKHTTMVPCCQSVNEPAPTERLGVS